MSLIRDLYAFYRDHQRCGELDEGVEGDCIWFTCSCGATIKFGGGPNGTRSNLQNSSARFDYAVTRAEQEYAGMSEPTALACQAAGASNPDRRRLVSQPPSSSRVPLAGMP